MDFKHKCPRSQALDKGTPTTGPRGRHRYPERELLPCHTAESATGSGGDRGRAAVQLRGQ